MQNSQAHVYRFNHKMFALQGTLEAISSKPLTYKGGNSSLEMDQFIQVHSSRRQIQTRTPRVLILTATSQFTSQPACDHYILTFLLVKSNVFIFIFKKEKEIPLLVSGL